MPSAIGTVLTLIQLSLFLIYGFPKYRSHSIDQSITRNHSDAEATKHSKGHSDQQSFIDYDTGKQAKVSPIVDAGHYRRSRDAEHGIFNRLL